jgi:nudix-type nucleoside diphosphatase (YffH/AdpP family)
MPDSHADRPSTVNIIKRERAHDGFFKLDRLTVAHEMFAGGMSAAKTWEVLERGDSAAALLFDVDRQEVILVDQFRAPTLNKGVNRGWLIETTAGIIRADETPESSLYREIKEETGYRVNELSKIATFFASPSGSSERIHLYYAAVRRTDQVGAGGGIKEDGEDIRLFTIGLDSFFRKLGNREFEDAKIIIAGLWFKERHARTELSFDKGRSTTRRFALKSDQKRVVGYKTGNILLTRDVDVWVNNENTDMMMDRFFGRSISAAIRFAGAEKFDESERVRSDTIADALRTEMRGRTFVKPATVLETTSGALERSHNVRRLFHVGAVEGTIGQGVRPNLEMLERCVDDVLAAIDAASRRTMWPYRSVLIPMLGTGEGGFLVQDVAPRLIERAVKYLENQKKSTLQEIYFVAYAFGDAQVIDNVMEGNPQLTTLGDDATVSSSDAPGTSKAAPS